MAVQPTPLTCQVHGTGRVEQPCHEDRFTVYSSCGSPSIMWYVPFHLKSQNDIGEIPKSPFWVLQEQFSSDDSISTLELNRGYPILRWGKKKCLLQIIIFSTISKSVTVSSTARKVWNAQIGFTKRPAWFPTRALRRTYWSTEIASNNPAVIPVSFAGPAMPSHTAKVSIPPDTLHTGGLL